MELQRRFVFAAHAWSLGLNMGTIFALLYIRCLETPQTCPRASLIYSILTSYVVVCCRASKQSTIFHAILRIEYMHYSEWFDFLWYS
jgi:hypothetical protein